MKSLNSVILTVVFWGCSMFVYVGKTSASIVESDSITFFGEASGGVLTLTKTVTTFARHYVSIETSAGESAESVAKRLASSFVDVDSDPFGIMDPSIYRSREGPPVYAEGPKLRGLPGMYRSGCYLIAGTEKGLGIPKSPLSLSGAYDIRKNKIFLRWVNPTENYDSIGIVFNGDAFYGGLPGTSTSYIFDKISQRLAVWSKSEKLISIGVVGYRGDVPSNVAAIHISEKTQEEITSVPFTNGVMPNWSSWSTSCDPSAVAFEQGTDVSKLENAKHFPAPQAKNKPFYQIIKTFTPKVQAGIWRKFLGLTPGHTYRISVRLSTLAMDSTKSDWSFSFHAVHNGRSGANLTVEQLAGQKALPDGSSGPQAGQIALYQPSVTTEGKFLQRTTDDSGPGQEITNITLPKGVDTITIWFRHTGANSTGVSFDWVKLEDVTEEITSLSDIADTTKDSADDAKPVEKAVQANPKNKKRQPDTTVYDVSIANSPILGPKDAPVTIVEFSDFQCPYCVREFPKLQKILDEYPDQVRLVFKHYPLKFHKNAPAVHAATELALRQRGVDAFWMMHQMIMDAPKELDIAQLREYAVGLELNMDMFDKTMASEATINELLKADKAEAGKCNVSGTPTILINGLKLTDRSIEGYKARIDGILAETAK